MRTPPTSIVIMALLFSSTSKGDLNTPEKSETKDYCGYHIEGKLAKEIINAGSETNNGIRRKTVVTTIDLGTRNIPASIEFSCYASTQPSTEENKTAKSEIEREDSGGRYYRIVNWERPIKGKNWPGTIAYVTTIFGDGEKITVPDQFFICPKKSNNPCFYINIDLTTRLSSSDSKKVQKILSDISIKQKTPSPPSTK
ncbi:hypothetical protein ACNFBT_22270 [Pseudomonas sp. NY15181]|uniref:hypothetical protein n=1 Tax=Pseudomonas sp. NY15181 TaxID=3400349 RepID=UPI003A8BAF84